jgi:ferredoxin-NADP reductase
VPHLGFGQGVHACLGAPLARLLLRLELEVLDERLPGLEIADPAAARRRTEVGESRGMASLPLRWKPTPPRPRSDRCSTAGAVATVRTATVTGRRSLTADVVELTVLVDGDAPRWEPGAHVDLHLSSGLVRQYSLCGPLGADTWRVAVLREPDGRGGSAAVHDQVRVGDRLTLGGPRNHFALRPASTVRLVAGGIGITPLLPMAERADELGLDWSLLYLGRSRSGMAYADELFARHPDRVTLWPSEERGRHDLGGLWASDAVVHACGPEPLVAALEESARRHGAADRLVVERFAPRRVEHGPARPFEAELARRGTIVRVAADESLLEAINRAGAGVLSTCREGTCGTCEVRVLAGSPEHRDAVLSSEERLSGTTMMTCVSRCRGSRLVLDL